MSFVRFEGSYSPRGRDFIIIIKNMRETKNKNKNKSWGDSINHCQSQESHELLRFVDFAIVGAY